MSPHKTEHSTDYAEANRFKLFLLNGASSVLVIGRYLITLDSVLGALLSAGLTYYVYHISKDDGGFDGTMSWVLLGFAVIMPISVSIRITFERRERALQSIASLRSHAYMIYLCHSSWDWGAAPGGRKESGMDWVAHSDRVLKLLVEIGDDLARFLTLPNSTRPRHRQLKSGRREAAITVKAAYQLLDGIITHNITKISILCEKMKLAGFSPSEASRLRQWEKLFVVAVEDLRMVKMYRSPNALRCLSNIFTVFLPPLYAPAFAQIAHDTDSVGLAVFFAVIASIALTALFSAVEVLEDPFVAFLTLDGIDVYEELQVLYYKQLLNTRRAIFPDAPDFDENASNLKRLSISMIPEGNAIGQFEKQSDRCLDVAELIEEDGSTEETSDVKSASSTASHHSAKGSTSQSPPRRNRRSLHSNKRKSSIALFANRSELMNSFSDSEGSTDGSSSSHSSRKPRKKRGSSSKGEGKKEEEVVRKVVGRWSMAQKKKSSASLFANRDDLKRSLNSSATDLVEVS